MYEHKPVLLREAIDALRIKEGGKYIDCTLGGGGHTAEILKRGGVVLGIDVDKYAVDFCNQRFGKKVSNGRLKVIRANFKEVDQVVTQICWSFGGIDGILYDLGLSTFQLKHEKKGFSFMDDVPLDMRMDDSLEVTASDLLLGLSEKELEELFRKYGEEPQARRFARAIKKSTDTTQGLIVKASEVAEIIRKASKYKHSKIHPATRVFQALRIAVNSELENFGESTRRATSLLKPKGRLVTIAFHSLEDKIAKNLARSPALKAITRAPIVPSQREIRSNPSSRSAKMRIYEKV